MKKISFNFKLKNLEGKEIEDAHAGKQFAIMIASSTEGNPVKLMAWALLLHGEKDIEVDKADFELIKDLIIKSKEITNLTKSQLIDALGEFK